jgi:hypothetical protein
LKFSSKEATHHDVAVQTDPEIESPSPKKRSRNASVSTTSALDRKIRSFERNVLKPKPKVQKQREEKPIKIPKLSPTNTTPLFSPPQPLRFQHAVSSSTIELTPSPKMLATPEPMIPPRPPKDQEEDDKIMKELASMFDDDDGKASLQEIFEDCANPQIDQIMHEIESYNESQVEEQTKQLSPASSSKMKQIEAISAEELERRRQKEVEHTLKNSIWPCELHMQTMRLRETISRVAEEDMYKLEIVSNEVFGRKIRKLEEILEKTSQISFRVRVLMFRGFEVDSLVPETS